MTQPAKSSSQFFRTPAFWIGFAVVSALLALYAFTHFSKAFPLVSVDIRMDRAGALKTAAALAIQHNWAPQVFAQAASFDVDQPVQNFVELEGGGKEALSRMIADRTYAPYTWIVRHFKEGDPHEVTIRFTPEGEPYGFVLKIPESEAGAILAQDDARNLAERSAASDWRVDFTRYALVESSQETKPGGRKDYTFVYERPERNIDEGRYRLKLVVAGNRLGELSYFVQVPEAFNRRYEQMRATNTSINAIASLGVILYLLGFAGVGLFFMMRQGWLIWKPAVLCAAVIAFIAALGELNAWPLIWMGYDTALPAGAFAFRQLAAIAGTFLINVLVFALSFMAAETLSRRAFPHHPQFWKVWSSPVAASPQVLGRTLAGYLTVSFAVAYIIVFYAFTQRVLGWWIPSDTLVNPDVFAAYLPSFSAFAQSAQAGFWEECLFRAVPLATFALIGDRFGKRGPFLVAGMLLQALVFGSGHAGYANQPGYARVVELIVPSLIFGGYFLAFGLLPGIVMHYTFDSVLISLPIFAASTARAHFEQVLAAVLMAIPLLVVLVARRRQGRWRELTWEERNAGWTPRPLAAAYAAKPEIAIPAGAMHPWTRRLLPFAGLAAIIAWLLSADFRLDVPGVAQTREDAVQLARQELARRGVQLDASWTPLSRIEAQPEESDRFVWQVAGRAVYRHLLGNYLPAPHWLVRFVRLEGDVAERAEEYQLSISGDGTVYRVRHPIPESRPGGTLSQDQAEQLARSSLQETLHLAPGELKEVSAEASKRPQRTDWQVEFKDSQVEGLDGGEARAAIEIAGENVIDAARYIHVPEQWQRDERRQRNLPDIVSVMMNLLGLGIITFAAVIAAVRWSRGRAFSRSAFVSVGLLVWLLSLLAFANNWSTTVSGFSTSQPFILQAGVLVAIALVSSTLLGGAVGLAAGLVGGVRQSGPASLSDVIGGLSLGFVMAAVRIAALAIRPSLAPGWPDFSNAGAILPLVAGTLDPLTSFIRQAVLISLVFYAADRFSAGFRYRKGATTFLILTMGWMTSASRSVETLASWLISGALIGLALVAAYLLVLRYRPDLVVWMVAGAVILSQLQEGLQLAFPSALAGSIAGSLLLLGTALYCFRKSAAPANLVE